jgi:hypothetical protein
MENRPDEWAALAQQPPSFRSFVARTTRSGRQMSVFVVEVTSIMELRDKMSRMRLLLLDKSNCYVFFLSLSGFCSLYFNFYMSIDSYLYYLRSPVKYEKLNWKIILNKQTNLNLLKQCKSRTSTWDLSFFSIVVVDLDFVFR